MHTKQNYGGGSLLKSYMWYDYNYLFKKLIHMDTEYVKKHENEIEDIVGIASKYQFLEFF